MKLYVSLSLAASASAFVILTEQMANQLQFQLQPKAPARHLPAHLPVPLPAPLEGMFDGLARTAEAAEAGDIPLSALPWEDRDLLDSGVNSAGVPDSLNPIPHPHHPRHPHKSHHPHHEKTVYELISTSKYTTKLASFLEDYPHLIKALNCSNARHTVFAPIDEAFDHISEDKKPDKDVIEAIIKYHIGRGLYPTKRLFGTHTIPTLLDEDLIGGKPQRLRTKLGIWGLNVNFYHKVVARDIPASNGVIHAVQRIIYPPQLIGKELSLAPSIFSTLLHAYEKTGFIKDIHQISLNGSTVFAPTNRAFEKLGMRVNAFLFNSDRGLEYLKALLKYHVAPNVTLYTDAMYDNRVTEARFERPRGKHYHVELPTLLENQTISVDIFRFLPLHYIKVNAKTSVTVSDVVARNGVVQVVSDLLFPHRHPPDAPDALAEEGEMTVEELVRILSPFVETEKNEESTQTVFNGDL